MRIKSIELSWFRGAAEPISLETNCKSMVVYGENGSGKSSFVDAVEYVLNRGKIQHLTSEYSGTRQVNAIPNTHKSVANKTGLRFRFEDDSELEVDIRPNGPPKSSGALDIGMDNWEYRQTVLRQHEVSAFIHDTKGKKYSALLPLFGLHNLEIAAENLRKLAKAVEDKGKLREKRAVLNQIESQRKEALGELSDDQILEIIDDLHKQYCGDGSTTNNTKLKCNEVESAIGSRIEGYSAEDRKHLWLKEVAGSNLKSKIDALRACSVDLAGQLDAEITEKLRVLKSTSGFLDSMEAIDTVECPACGRTIAVVKFREHVELERLRLQEMEVAFNRYTNLRNDVCNALGAVNSNLNKPELKNWREGLDENGMQDCFEYLKRANLEALRENCNEQDLNAIENNVLPIVIAAKHDSKSVPPDVKELTGDKKKVEISSKVIDAKCLEDEITSGDELVSLITSLELGIRQQIRQRSQNVIDDISHDIESMWSILHPAEQIDRVRLSLPSATDKAIDVVLQFHGKNQDSPRLTLSEGFRNSLGLCIFLAMAKRGIGVERPLFLDDVVVSLDRHHRGMILELLTKEFSDRQVIIFTHDRGWYTELRYQLGGDSRWIFKTLLPYETPDIGIRWSHKTTTFDDARAMIQDRPDSAGSDARKIMDVELPIIAERLQTRLPYLRSDKNDRRMAHEFLVRLVADGKKCFQKKSGNNHIKNTSAIDAWSKADNRLLSWGNTASHTFDVVRPEAIKLIEACEIAIASFKCDSCDRYVWRLEDKQSKLVQCQCGDIRWRYGKA